MAAMERQQLLQRRPLLVLQPPISKSPDDDAKYAMLHPGSHEEGEHTVNTLDSSIF